MHHPIRIFTYSFIIILTLMIVLIFAAFRSGIDVDYSQQQRVSQILKKVDFAQELSMLINNRTRFMQSLLLDSVDSREKNAYVQFDKTYAEVRQGFKPLLNAREREHLASMDRLNREISELNQQVSVLARNGSGREATRVLLEEILPKTTPQLRQLDELIRLMQADLQRTLQNSQTYAEISRQNFMVFALISILISLAVAALAVIYGQRRSSRLEEMNDYLEDRIHERTESLLDAQKELLEDNNELARLASTDALTGLSNRTHMAEILTKEHSRYQRHQHRFGIIMLDVDHFKLINDSHGHDVGDRVLVQLAQQLESALRSSDHIGRWGGEEFLICCTNIETDNIKTIAENIRQTIANTKFDVVGKLTASLGCAIVEPEESIKALIKRADVALYQAKNGGRNQTVVLQSQLLAETS